jgi:UDP-glucose 4-epimerase
MKNKTIAVSGGSGFIASHLIKALKKENPKEIYNIDLKTRANLTEYREIEVFFEQHKIDVVFDLATLPLPVSLKNPYKVVNDITKMMLNLCELQRVGMFGRLVHISSSEAYGTASCVPMSEDHHLKPRTPYAAGKASADLIGLAYFQTFGSDIIIPRCYNAYGPGQPLNWGAVIPKTINKILNGDPPIVYKDGKQTRDFVFVKDLAKGIIEVGKLDQKGIIVNIGTGIETPITDLIHLICKLMGFEGKPQIMEQRVADVSRHCADTSLLKSLTGFTPKTKLEDGLKETIEYYRKNANLPTR